jgi:superfamily II DNA or RNA helicase
MDKYNYQPIAASNVLIDALSQQYEASVLAAAPGAGKSTILIYILNMFFEQRKHGKSMILTHNQNILKNQMINGFEVPNVEVKFTYGEINGDSMVQVGLPGKIEQMSEIDLLVVDEAHEYFWEKMYNNVIEKCKPKYIILMTGSPSYFIRYNKAASMSRRNTKKFAIHFISARELLERGIFSPVDLDVVKSESIQDVVEYAKKQDYDMTKIMVACKDILKANEIANYLTSTGRRVSLSTSHNDFYNDEVDKFVKNQTNTLVVVNKGVLGFSDNELTMVIDLKCSKDIEVRNQLFSRLMRKHPDGRKKYYLSICREEKYKEEVYLLNDMVKLMDRKNLITYDGTDSWKYL